MMSGPTPPRWRQIAWDAVDALFIMALCFAVLLTTMVLRGKVLVGAGGSEGLSYVVNPWTAALVVLALVSYIVFMLRQSDAELREMVNDLYDAPTGTDGSELR